MTGKKWKPRDRQLSNDTPGMPKWVALILKTTVIDAQVKKYKLFPPCHDVALPRPIFVILTA